MRAQTIQPSGSPFSTTVITWLTRSGCARLAPAPRMLSTMTTASAFLCSRRNGSSCEKRARGPSSGVRRAKGLRERGARSAVDVDMLLLG